MTSVQSTRSLATYLYFQYETPRKSYYFIRLPYDITGHLHTWLKTA